MNRSLIGRGLAALAALSLVSISPAIAANISVKDGAGTTQTMCTAVQSDSSQAYCFVYHNAAGAQEDLATKAQMSLLTSANGNPTDPYSIATDGTSASEIALLKGEIFEQKALITLLGAPAQAGGKIDTVIQGTSANRSVVIGFVGTASSATSASTSLPVTVTSTFTNQSGNVSGIPIVGQIVSGTGIAVGTTITAVTGSAGSYTLTLSAAATVASAAAVTSGGPQLVMALNAARRGFSQQNQSTVTTAAGNCGVNGLGSATLDANSLIIAGSSYYETKDSHTGTGAIADICGTAATPVYIREW